MIFDILSYKDPHLKQPSMILTRFDKALEEFCMSLAETMYWSSGLGLSAPQVKGIHKIFVMDTKDGFDLRVCVNPQILQFMGEPVGDQEGCLSFPGIVVPVRRYASVVVQYQDITGKIHSEALEGWPARVFQHEMDHLDGIVLTDRVPMAIKKRILRTLKE